jgi:hypothetical protein
MIFLEAIKSSLENENQTVENNTKEKNERKD